ncbi:Ionotropic receptor 229 [Frankliniella occidentalis]|nr:Ionotropic receptor 229 [Frankliniella occidentalis]
MTVTDSVLGPLLAIAVGVLATATHAALRSAAPVVPAESASVLRLLVTAMALNGTLFVDIDDVEWLDDSFLRRLPSEMPRVLVQLEHYWETSKDNWGADMNTSVILVARRRAGTLVDYYEYLFNNSTVPFTPLVSSRVLFLTLSVSPSTTIARLQSSWPCWSTGALVVANPDGAASLLRVEHVDCRPGDNSSSTIRPLDRWSPTFGRWEAGVNPLIPLSGCCGGFVRPPGYAPMMLLEHTAYSVNRAAFKRAQLVARLIGLVPKEVERNDLEMMNVPLWDSYDSLVCRSVVVFQSLATKGSSYNLVDDSFVTELSRVVYVVPSGLGARRHPLQALVGEFPPALWCLSLLAALGVAGVLSRSAGCAEAPALLRAVAPMLEQPLPSRPTRHPLLATWMVVCVVLAAAYRGLLLKMLGRPPRGEISSLDELRASGLPVKSSSYLHPSGCTSDDCESFFPWRRTAINAVAVDRSCGLFVHLDHVPPWMLATGGVHVIPTEMRSALTQFYMPRMSPLAETVRRVLARIGQAGLMRHWEAWDAEELRRIAGLRTPTGPRPLELHAVLPPLLLLVCGLGVAAGALAAEVVAHRLSRARGARQHGVLGAYRMDASARTVPPLYFTKG